MKLEVRSEANGPAVPEEAKNCLHSRNGERDDSWTINGDEDEVITFENEGVT